MISKLLSSGLCFHMGHVTPSRNFSQWSIISKTLCSPINNGRLEELEATNAFLSSEKLQWDPSDYLLCLARRSRVWNQLWVCDHLPRSRNKRGDDEGAMGCRNMASGHTGERRLLHGRKWQGSYWVQIHRETVFITFCVQGTFHLPGSEHSLLGQTFPCKAI